MKSSPFLLRPTWDVNLPCVQHIPPHLVTQHTSLVSDRLWRCCIACVQGTLILLSSGTNAQE